MFKLGQQGAVTVVSGDCALSEENVDALTNAVRKCLDSTQPRIVIDLGDVPLADSAGLETLLNLYDEAQLRGGTIRLAAPTALVQDALDISDISSEIEVCDSTSQAVGRFSK